MKIRVLVIALVALVVVVAIAAAALSGRVDSYRPKIQAELQEKLKRPVSLGHLGLKLLPLEIEVDGFSIGEAASFPQDRPFAKASTVFVSASLFSLLRGSPEVQDIELDQPQIELIKNAAGVWNFSSLGQSGGNSSGGGSQFSLASLVIKDGQIGYTDEAAKQARAVYDHIDLKITDFAPNKQFGLNLGVHFPGEGKQTLEFNGKIGPLGGATENELPPVSGHLAIQEVSLAGVNKFAAGTLGADTDSVASGETDISTLADVISAKGSLKFENTTLNGAKLDYTISSTYNVEDDLKQKKLLIRSGELQLGPTKFTASGSVDTFATPAALNVQLKTSNSSITELAKLAGGLGVGFSPAYKVVGTVSADVTAKGPANAPQLNGSVVAKGLEASGGEIKTPVSISEIDLSLAPEAITSNTFTARSGGTSLAIVFTLGQYATKNMALDASVKTDGANIGELLNIAKTYGVEAAQGVSGDGKLSLDVHVKGPAANPSAVTFTGTASIADAKVTTPALRKPVTISSANAAFSQNTVTLSNLAATVGGTTVKGSLSAKNFAAPEVAFNLSADKIDTEELQNLPTPAPPHTPKKAGPKAAANAPGLLQLTTGSGTLAAGLIKANDIELKNVNAKCQIDKGVVTLSPLSADVFGGKANGSMSADLRPAAPLCGVKIKLAGVDANSLLSAVSSVKNTVEGKLAADTNLRFALAGGNDLAKTLNGVISFNLTDGVIKNINLLNEVEKAGKFLKGGGQDSSSSSGGTAVKKFSGTMNITNGVASTNNLTGVLSAGTVTSNGTLSLVSQDINMHATVATGGLTVPMSVTGNMAHPKVTPDMGAMAKANLGKLTGKKGVGGIVGGLLGGQSPGDAKTQQANPLNSIMNSFKKKPQ